MERTPVALKRRHLHHTNPTSIEPSPPPPPARSRKGVCAVLGNPARGIGAPGQGGASREGRCAVALAPSAIQ